MGKTVVIGFFIFFALFAFGIARRNLSVKDVQAKNGAKHEIAVGCVVFGVHSALRVNGSDNVAAVSQNVVKLQPYDQRRPFEKVLRSRGVPISSSVFMFLFEYPRLLLIRSEFSIVIFQGRINFAEAEYV